MTRPVALVTGASIGIGEQFARSLAERGHDVVLVARDGARLDVVAKELLERHGVTCEVVAADLTDSRQLAEVETRATAVDVLINNAGFGTTGRFDELDLDAEDRQIRLNVLALARLTHVAARAMVGRGRGGILNVASIAGFQPGPQNATYSATKAYVLSFTQAVHEELRDTGVSVTCLCPGFTRTQFQQRAGYDEREIPGFLWHDAAAVAGAGLDGLARNKAVVVPGALYKFVASATRLTPQAISRRVSGVVTHRITDD